VRQERHNGERLCLRRPAAGPLYRQRRSACGGDAGISQLAGNRSPGARHCRWTYPDQGGLNIEGLAWDPSRAALLFGVRSPVPAGRIQVLCIYLDTDAPWSTAALRVGPTLSIAKSDFVDPQGIRDIDYDAVRQEFLVVVGRSISGGNAPFELCTWDGAASTLNVLDFAFEPATMKPEGVTAFPGNGRSKASYHRRREWLRRVELTLTGCLTRCACRFSRSRGGSTLGVPPRFRPTHAERRLNARQRFRIAPV